jgi:hypothetical protein
MVAVTHKTGLARGMAHRVLFPSKVLQH